MPETSPVQPREIAGERRHLTVLFCDLVGSTEISARLDPEEWRELAADYHRAAAEAVTRFGGYVSKYLGDGVLAYFGWPEAHDNGAERAARAGLAMVDAVGALNRRNAEIRRPKLSVRIGIDRGVCVIGESHGSESEIFGDTVNIASLVQTVADPDTVVVTKPVHQLVSSLLIVEESGSHNLKGLAEPLELYRVIRASGARGRLQAAAPSGLTPFVGREDELRHLMNRWERTREGQGQVVAIMGEAGIGKSRLVQRFRELAESTPSSWIECATAQFLQNTPFHAVADMLQQLFRRSDDANTDECIAAMEVSFRLAGVKLPEAVALIAPLLSLDVPEKYPPLSMAPDQQRKRLLATLLAWLFGLARARPLVMVIEDLHWVDPSTLELIRLLVEQGATAQLFLLYTARPEFRAPWTPRTHHSHLTISRLSARNAREMVHQLVARSALSQEAVAKVTERTSGVPLFVEELTRAMLEKGEAKPTVDEIPATLHDSLLARLDRLGPGKEVAQIASVIGLEFSYQLLQEVSALPEDDLHSALAKLADTELIYARGFPPEATYSFKHALIRDAAYEALLKSKRKRVHERVARVLEVQFSETAERQPELLAHHYTEAGLSAGAISYWQKAGQKAAQGSAHLEAIAHLRKGLELVEMLPDAQERCARELALQTTLGPVLIATRGYAAPEVIIAYDRAWELCQQVGSSSQLPLVLFGLFAFYVVRANHEKALALGEHLLDLGETAQDQALLLEAHNALGLTFFFQGKFAGSREHLERCLALYDLQQHSALAFSYAGQDPGVTSGVFSAWASQASGYSDQALDRSRDAVVLAQQLSYPYSLAYARGIAAATHQFRNEDELTRDSAEASLGVATEYGFPFWSGFQTILLGWASAKRGKGEEGIAQINRGMEAYWSTGAELLRPYLLGLLADALAETGSTEQALAAIAEALLAVEKTGERFYEAELYRQKGELLLRCNGSESSDLTPLQTRGPEIQECFFKSISVAERQHAKWFELRAVMSLGRIWRKQGQKEAARRLLGEIYSWFTEGFDTVDLQDAKALLGELSE